jgi:hypothetical protein
LCRCIDESIIIFFPDLISMSSLTMKNHAASSAQHCDVGKGDLHAGHGAEFLLELASREPTYLLTWKEGALQEC